MVTSQSYPYFLKDKKADLLIITAFKINYKDFVFLHLLVETWLPQFYINFVWFK